MPLLALRRGKRVFTRWALGHEVNWSLRKIFGGSAWGESHVLLREERFAEPFAGSFCRGGRFGEATLPFPSPPSLDPLPVARNFLYRRGIGVYLQAPALTASEVCHFHLKH
jgi:hypothetical protein